MSASPIARQACASITQVIPSKRVLIHDSSELPDLYSSTPGGTLYSTTPGGTRIVYERAFLMNLKNSPLARTPPNNVPLNLLRGSPTGGSVTKPLSLKPIQQKPARNSPPKYEDHQEQFDMDL
ncbi:eukaryotic translation initiation factor 4E-binding protein [Anopheles bellator]|uniref:eukaryotic translation initiation factor 4E-binding protein n=1 Tax=Anopheles cruzii TaxID=68878 RepID=UPI0022EC1E44|nr:eukaryotic translation initiation factor 4E-binding protein [Anopheles cruzii]XP_058062140.1 eukaryotic translation initiation factor 4E-binding protein [Anopheles bellator]